MNPALLALLAARVVAGGGGSPTLSYVGATGGHTGITVGIGTPAANRIVIVAIVCETYNATSPATVTIGGVAATVAMDAAIYDPAAYRPRVTIAYAAVPTGTTAGVSFSATGTNRRGATIVWTVEATGLSVAGTDAAFDADYDLSAIAAPGFAIAAASTPDGYPEMSLTGMTSDISNSAFATGRGLLGASTETVSGTITSTLNGGQPGKHAVALVTFAT